MAKLRSINTKFWDDSYVMGLTPNAKLLYLYYLTNALTNISGVYEISLGRMEFDTKIGEKSITEILEKFKTDKKVTYKDGWLVIHNFIKNQSLNPKIIAGIKISLANAPNWTKTLIKLDRLYIDYDSPSQSNSNSNPKSNSNSAQYKKIQEDKQKIGQIK